MLHAVGAAEAGAALRPAATAFPDRESLFHGDEIVFTSLGEGSTSEGEFWEAVNVSCTRHLPVLFLVEDNGYAISVPVEVETAGGDISKIVRAFPGLHVETVDGTDFFASLRAMRAAADVRPRAQGSGARARARHPSLLALALRRREVVQDARRSARPRRGAIRSVAWRSS